MPKTLSRYMMTKHLHSRNGIVFAMSIICIIAFAVVAFTQKWQDEVQLLTNRVGAHMVLPEKERPTVATVTDISKLEGEPAFVDAVNGDRVLAYPLARELIVYRPSLDRIVSVATIYDRN